MNTHYKTLLIAILLALATVAPQGVYVPSDDSGVRLTYATAQATLLKQFTREFEVSVDSGIALSGTMTQQLRPERDRPGRWTFRNSIRVWGISATESSTFSEAGPTQLVPIFYRLTVPFGDNINEEFSGRQTGFDRLNVILQFERDFASNPDKSIWKYKVLNYRKPYSIQLKNRQTITLPNGAIARCKVFEAVHGSRNQLRTRFWMDVNSKRLVQIEHLEPDYTYKAVLKE